MATEQVLPQSLAGFLDQFSIYQFMIARESMRQPLVVVNRQAIA